MMYFSMDSVWWRRSLSQKIKFEFFLTQIDNQTSSFKPQEVS